MNTGHLDKKEVASAVVEAATAVLQDILVYPPGRGQLQVTPLQFTRDDVTVVSRLSGDITAEVFYGFSTSTALGVSAQMLRRESGELRSIEISALTELGNMITDRSVEVLESRGALCYGTSAGVVTGVDERITPFALPTLAIPLSLFVGEVNVNVLVEAYAPFDWATPAQRLQIARSVRLVVPGDDLPLAA